MLDGRDLNSIMMHKYRKVVMSTFLVQQCLALISLRSFISLDCSVGWMDVVPAHEGVCLMMW